MLNNCKSVYCLFRPIPLSGSGRLSSSLWTSSTIQTGHRTSRQRWAYLLCLGPSVQHPNLRSKYSRWNCKTDVKLIICLQFFSMLVYISKCTSICSMAVFLCIQFDIYFGRFLCFLMSAVRFQLNTIVRNYKSQTRNKTFILILKHYDINVKRLPKKIELVITETTLPSDALRYRLFPHLF